MLELRGYIGEHGNKPFAVWFDRLEKAAAARVAITLSRMERGNFSNVKSVGQGVFENRIDFGSGYRIYFCKDGGLLVILLCGGTKKPQERDIALAQARWADYKRRKK